MYHGAVALASSKKGTTSGATSASRTVGQAAALVGNVASFEHLRVILETIIPDPSQLVKQKSRDETRWMFHSKAPSKCLNDRKIYPAGRVQLSDCRRLVHKQGLSLNPNSLRLHKSTSPTDETTLQETKLVVVIDQYLFSLRPKCASSKDLNRNMSPTHCQTVHIFVHTYLEQNTPDPFADKRVSGGASPLSTWAHDRLLEFNDRPLSPLGLPRS